MPTQQFNLEILYLYYREISILMFRDLQPYHSSDIYFIKNETETSILFEKENFTKPFINIAEE